MFLILSARIHYTDSQLGNYLGLFLPFLELQKNSAPTTPIYLSIVGLHAITLPRDPQQLREDRRDMLACLIAAGVDPQRTCLYFQEDVSVTNNSWERARRYVGEADSRYMNMPN